MDDYEDLDQSHTLKDVTKLTNIQINQLIHNEQKFNNIIKQLNQNAISKIHEEKPVEALLLLAEGEKILQYGANCGKAIDRNIINCILHNEACCYQKMWELQKCCNYIEALIYNINLHLDIKCASNIGSEDRIVTSTSLNSCGSQSYKGKPIGQRVQLAKHHLQYCALNSQMKKHPESCHHALKSINIFRQMFKQLNEISKNTDIDDSRNQIDETSSDLLARIKMISGLAACPEQVSFKKKNQYFYTAKHCFRKWSSRKSQTGNIQIKTSFRNFSIGTVMQLKPQSLDQNKQHTSSYDYLMQSLQEFKNKRDVLKSQTTMKLINYVVMLSLAYFSVATELRLISSDNYRFMDQNKKHCKQYQQSEIYHLIAIILLLIYVPYDMPLIRHVVTSYTNQYGQDIAQPDDQVLQEQLDKIIEEFDVANFSGFYSKKFQLYVDKEKQLKKTIQQKSFSKNKSKKNSQSNSRDKLKNSVPYHTGKRKSFKLKKQKEPGKSKQKSKSKSKSNSKSKSKSKSKTHSKSKSKTNIDKVQNKTISHISKEQKQTENIIKTYSNDRKKLQGEQNAAKTLKSKSSPKKISIKSETNSQKLKFVRINPNIEESKGQYYKFEKNQVSHKKLRLNIQSPKEKQPQTQKNSKKQKTLRNTDKRQIYKK